MGDMAAGNRYNAACCAALAAAGAGEDAEGTTAAERRAWRALALGWLRADLGEWRRRLAGGAGEGQQKAAGTLRWWRWAPDLAAVRDEGAPEPLPEGERGDWKGLWAEVAALLGEGPTLPEGLFAE